MKITQHTKFDDNFNIVEHVEKDSVGNIILKQIYNEKGQLITSTKGDVIECYNYNEKGLLINKNDSNGKETNFAYNRIRTKPAYVEDSPLENQIYECWSCEGSYLSSMNSTGYHNREPNDVKNTGYIAVCDCNGNFIKYAIYQ